MNSGDIQRQQCRACLEEVKSYKYFSEPIDFASDQAQNIFTAFIYCTNLDFDEQETSEVIKQFICNSCVNSLKFAYEFIKKARESDSHLRVVIDYVENENQKFDVEEDDKYDESIYEKLEEIDEEVVDYDDQEEVFDTGEEVEESEVVKDDLEIIVDSTLTFQKDDLGDVSMQDVQDVEVETEEYILEEIDEIQDGNYATEDVSGYIMTSVEDEPAMVVSVDSSKAKKPLNDKTAKKITKKGPLKNNHKCKECSKAFAYNFQLNHHIKVTHLDEDIAKNFVCFQCDKKFYTKRHLVKHETTVHREGRDFKCDICGKEFQYKERLTRHMKTHIDRKYDCPHCSKTYVQNADLVIHMRTHTKEKPYQCDQCSEAYLNQSRLTNHIKRVHMDVTYTCRYCKAYEVKSHSTLRRHEQEHLKFPYQCPKCDKECSRRKYFKDHMFNAHDGFELSDAELDAMFIKNKNEIKRMEAEFGNSKSFFISEIVEEEIIEEENFEETEEVIDE
ncbi:hypothetical protein ACFFRR_001974 [Megaselia abdita]